MIKMSKHKSQQHKGMRMCKFTTESGSVAYATILHFCTICMKPLLPGQHKFDHMSDIHPEYEVERTGSNGHYIYSHAPCGCEFSDIECVIEHVKERKCPVLNPSARDDVDTGEAKLPVRPSRKLSSVSVRVVDENNILRSKISGLECRITELESELAEKVDKHARGLKDRDRAVATAKRYQKEAEEERDKLQDKLSRDVKIYKDAMHKLGRINDELEKENKSLKDRIDFLAAALAAGEEKPIGSSGTVATEKPPVEESPPEEHQEPEGRQEE